MKKNNKLAAAIAANVENQVTGIINAESTTSKKETSAKAKKTSKPKAKVKELPAAKKEATIKEVTKQQKSSIAEEVVSTRDV